MDHLCDECSEHFAALCEYLDLLGRRYVINHQLVRGLDYYTKTVFEVWAAGIGAQAAVCGGGRYDGLAEILGGPPTPGVGVAVGLERIILVMKDLGVPLPKLPTPPVFVAYLGAEAKGEALRVADDLRQEGVAAWLAFGNRGLRSQLREADKRAARFVVILGEDELARGVATVKDMRGGQTAVAREGLVSWVKMRV
jgi:histidyl-tRNA synthetase